MYQMLKKIQYYINWIIWVWWLTFQNYTYQYLTLSLRIILAHSWSHLKLQKIVVWPANASINLSTTFRRRISINQERADDQMFHKDNQAVDDKEITDRPDLHQLNDSQPPEDAALGNLSKNLLSGPVWMKKYSTYVFSSTTIFTKLLSCIIK